MNLQSNWKKSFYWNVIFLFNWHLSGTITLWKWASFLSLLRENKGSTEHSYTFWIKIDRYYMGKTAVTFSCCAGDWQGAAGGGARLSGSLASRGRCSPSAGWWRWPHSGRRGCTRSAACHWPAETGNLQQMHLRLHWYQRFLPGPDPRQQKQWLHSLQLEPEKGRLTSLCDSQYTDSPIRAEAPPFIFQRDKSSRLSVRAQEPRYRGNFWVIFRWVFVKSYT